MVKRIEMRHNLKGVPQMKYYIAVILSFLILDSILIFAFYGAWTEEYNAEPSETEKQAVAYYSAHLPTPTEE